MKIAFNPSTVAALIAPPNNKDITFDLRGHNIFARGVKFCGTDTNTWRDIKINNVSIDSNILDLRDGDNTTLTNINGVVTINSTWRPVVDNLTSDSTTSSLSAKQGKVLKSLIDGKSNSGHTHDDRYLKLTGGTISGRLLVNSDSNSYTTPSIAINYYDSYTVNDYSITQIKMGNPKYDMYLGLSPAVKGRYGKIGYFMHADTDCEFLWGTSGWIKRMALECSSGNLWVSGSITAGKFHSNASASTDLTVIPPDTAIALETGNGNGVVNSWIWRENYTSSNWGIFHNNSEDDSINFVGNNRIRVKISLGSNSLKVGGTEVSLEGHTHDDRYVKKSGDTMRGALNFANGTWNLVGDDSYMGDCNISGHFGIKAANTTYPGIAFFNNANAHLGNLTAYSGNIKYGAYSLQFLDNGNTSVSASTWMNPFSSYDSNAVADGQAICVWGQSSYLSNLANDTGDMSLWLRRVNANAATLNMVLDGEYYANGNQRLAHVSEIPNSLKNPHALTISLNGTSQGPYDGSAAKSINITPGSIGAATSNHNHDGRYVYNYGGTQMDGASIDKNALGMTTNSGITGDWWHILQAAWNGEHRWNSQIAFPTQNRNGMYYRSGLDDNTAWGAWVKLLDVNNYSSILDSRYYTESEVNSLLDAKLNRQNLSYGTWNPRGYNLAADYQYNGGDLSISESGGQIHVSVDGYFWQNEGQYRVLDTSDVAGLKNNLTVHQYLSNTDTTWWPLIWGGGSHNNTSDSTGEVYKSHDVLSWQTSSQTLYATHLRTTDLNTQTALFHPDDDSTLKIYSGRTQDAVSDGHIGLQTSIDGTDGQTHVYPTQWGSRCVLALQPRGGSVYIGNMPNGGNGRKLNVNGDIGLFNVGSIRDLTIGGGIYWNPYVESATDGSDAASITLVKSGVAGGTTLVLSQMNDANDTIQFQTNGSARLYHNSYPILTTQNTYVSNNKGYINNAEITQVNNSDKVDNRHAISTTPNTGIIYKAAIYTSYSLTSYWVRLASIPSISQNAEFIATIHVQSGHSNPGRSAILLVYLRGNASSFMSKSFKIGCNSNYDPNRFRLYYKDSDKTSEIWYQTTGQWDGIITTVISQSSEGSLYEGLTLYSGSITTVQTPSMSTYLSAQVSTITDNISGNASTATKLQTSRLLWGQSFDGTRDISGSIHIVSTGGGWNEGIRMHIAQNSWCGLVMCGSDNTGTSGTSAKTWSMHNNDGKFYIAQNGSNSFTNGISCVNGTWAILSSGNVGIGTTNPSSKLTVNGVGNDKSPVQLVNASRNGTWVYTASFLAPNLTSNNNNAIFIGKAHSTCNAFGLTHMHIGDGSVNNYAALEVWGVGNVQRWYYDRHSSFLHRADFSSLGSDASYMNSALQIREHGYNGVQADTWANAPRMSWHWSGRVQTQIGLGSNNELYLSKNNFGNAYKLVYETGTWGINISGNAASATKSEYSRSLLGRSTSGSDYDTNRANLVFAEWDTMHDNRWYLKATGCECRVAYANSAKNAANADTVDGTHLNGIFTAFGNNAHNITATIGGVTKSFLVNWAADSDKLDGYHASSSSKPWGTIPVITTQGFMDIGNDLEFHYDNTTGSDYSTALMCQGNYNNIVYLPSASGTLALTSDIPNPTNYYWANVKISTSSSTTTSPTVSDLTATNSIKMGNISLEHTDEINNITNESLHLNYRNTGNITLCNGGGAVTIGTTSTDIGGNKLYVNGSEFINGASNVKDYIFANGFRHRSYNSNNAVLLAGGGYMIHKTGTTEYSTAIQFGKYVWLTIQMYNTIIKSQVVPDNISKPTKIIYVQGGSSASGVSAWYISTDGILYMMEGGTSVTHLFTTICYVAS